MKFKKLIDLFENMINEINLLDRFISVIGFKRLNTFNSIMRTKESKLLIEVLDTNNRKENVLDKRFYKNLY